jgi:hypothetical protein
MNKSIFAYMLIPALLTGCGGGGGGSSSITTKTPVTYQWQIVQLKSVAESELGSSCIIYADSEETDGNVVSAVVATDDYNILYHNADGSIAKSFAASNTI